MMETFVNILVTSLYIGLIYLLVHTLYVVHKTFEEQKRELDTVVEFGHRIEMQRLHAMTSKSLDMLSSNIEDYKNVCAMDPNEKCVMCKRCPHRKECQ